MTEEILNTLDDTDPLDRMPLTFDVELLLVADWRWLSLMLLPLEWIETPGDVTEPLKVRIEPFTGDVVTLWQFKKQFDAGVNGDNCCEDKWPTWDAVDAGEAVEGDADDDDDVVVVDEKDEGDDEVQLNAGDAHPPPGGKL